MKSYLARPESVDRRWVLIDASDKVLGRLAVQIANILRGRTKPTYTPHVDTGDFVIVINADKVILTGSKEFKKTYEDYSGYMGGRKVYTAKEIRRKHPDRLVRGAVKGMIPRNRLGRRQLRKLKVYAGASHPHEAQKPELLTV